MTKKLFAALILAVLLSGCAGVTDLIYGPEMAPSELNDAIYQDAFAIGAIWVSRDASKADDLIAGAQKVLDSKTDASDALTSAWLYALKKGDTDEALMLFAVRRLYGRLGIKFDGQMLDMTDVDKGMMDYAAQAFIDGVKAAR